MNAESRLSLGASTLPTADGVGIHGTAASAISGDATGAVLVDDDIGRTASDAVSGVAGRTAGAEYAGGAASTVAAAEDGGVTDAGVAEAGVTDGGVAARAGAAEGAA